MDQVARRGPLARAPDALEWGILPELSSFLSQLKAVFGGKFSNSLTLPKTERMNPLGFWSTDSVVKYQRNWERENFIIGNKSHNAEQTERGDTLGFFSIHSVAKQHKFEGGPIEKKNSEKKNLAVPKQTEARPFEKKNSKKKISQCRKKMKEGPVGLARYGMLQGNRKNLLGSVRYGRWCNFVQ